MANLAASFRVLRDIKFDNMHDKSLVESWKKSVHEDFEMQKKIDKSFAVSAADMQKQFAL